MNYEEFSFMNQQLAGMLRDGLPLEGALRQLCQSLHRGRLRVELEALAADLALGTPLREALGQRRLPPFYTRMVLVGLEGNDLPGVLTLLADYYLQANSIWTRLKGLMVYPLIVLLASLVLSAWLATVITMLARAGGMGDPVQGTMFAGSLRSIFTVMPAGALPGAGLGASGAATVWAWVNLWLPPLLLAGSVSLTAVVLSSARCRRWLRWHLPAFREASLSQLASGLGLMIKSGSRVSDAIGVLRHLEQGTSMGRELARWEARCAQGHGRFADIAAESRFIPPLFRWLVASAGEDLAAGFFRAAGVYSRRALYRRELLINAALPVSLLLLGFMIMGQVYPFTAYVYGVFSSFFNFSSIIGR